MYLAWLNVPYPSKREQRPSDLTLSFRRRRQRHRPPLFGKERRSRSLSLTSSRLRTHRRSPPLCFSNDQHTAPGCKSPYRSLSGGASLQGLLYYNPNLFLRFQEGKKRGGGGEGGARAIKCQPPAHLLSPTDLLAKLVYFTGIWLRLMCSLMRGVVCDTCILECGVPPLLFGV